MPSVMLWKCLVNNSIRKQCDPVSLAATVVTAEEELTPYVGGIATLMTKSLDASAEIKFYSKIQ